MAFELPTIGSSSSKSSFTPPFSYKPPKSKKKKKKELTARQMALLLAALKAQEHRSFGDRLKGIGSGALGGASWAMDKLMRPSWAVTSAISEIAGGESDTKYKNPFSAAWGGFTGNVRKGFGEILDEQNILEGHGRIRAGVGFGLDVVTDPTLLLSAAAAPVTGGSSLAAYAALKAAGKAAAPKLIKEAAREAGEKALKGETDDILEEVLQYGGKDFQHRLGLLQKNKTLKEMSENVMAHSTDELADAESQLHIAQSMARTEAKITGPKKLAFTYGTPKHHATLRTPIPLLTRPGHRLVQKQVPILAQLSDKLGHAFIPGFDNPTYRAGEIARQHVAENNAVIGSDAIGHILKGIDEKLSEDEMLDALHYFEQPIKNTRGNAYKAVTLNKAKTAYVLNEKYAERLIKDRLLTPTQVDFARRYQMATERLIQIDKAAGVRVEHLGQSGRMYVPHVVKKTGDEVPTVAQHGLLSEAAFQKGREGAALSVKQIKQLVKEGKLESDIETNPLALLARRNRAGAERQADMALINTLKTAVGVSSRIVDGKRVGRAEARYAAALAKREGAVRAAAHAEEQFHGAVDKAKEDLVAAWQKADRNLNYVIKDAKKNAKAKKMTELEKQYKRLRKPEKKAAVEEEMKKLKRASVTTPRVIKLQAKKIEIKKTLDDTLKRIENPRSNAHKELLSEPHTAFTTAKKALADARKEVRNASKNLSNARKGKKNRAVTDDMIEAPSKLDTLDEFGNPMRFPKEAQDPLFRLQRLVNGEDKTVEEFTRGVGKWMGAWKILVTAVNPGYRIRNTMTDFWNMWLAGVPPWAVGKYGTKTARLMAAAKKGDWQALRTIKEAADHGILSGLFAGDIYRVAQAMKYSGSKRSLAKDKHFIRLYTKIAQDVNKNAENWGRLTHYMYRRQALKESAAEAAFQVKMAHFDYEDLTEFEQKIMKKVFPFYTWSRKNIPYQVKQIFANPGRYSAFPKLVQESEYASKGEGPIPDYLESNMAFRIPFGTNQLYTPQFGVSDLAPFQGKDQAWDRVKSMLSPQYKIPGEIITGKSFFTGEDIVPENHTMVPFSGRGAGFLDALPGVSTGQTYRKGSGNMPGINPWAAWALGQIPMARAGFGIGAGTDEKKRQQAISYLGGQSVTQVNPEQQIQFELIKIQEDTDRFLAGLKDQGLIPRNERGESEFDKLLKAVLKGRYNG